MTRTIKTKIVSFTYNDVNTILNTNTYETDTIQAQTTQISNQYKCSSCWAWTNFVLTPYLVLRLNSPTVCYTQTELSPCQFRSTDS